MGASDSHADAGCDAHAVPAGSGSFVPRRVLLLEAGQLEVIEKRLLEVGASAIRAVVGDETSERTADDDGEWMAFYDNEAFALTARGWWLCEHRGDWRLRVPPPPLPFGDWARCPSCRRTTAGAPEGGDCPRCKVPVESLPAGTVHMEEYTAADEILEVAGLTQHAELLRKGQAKRVERLLAQADVVPFARVRAERRTYGLCCKDGALAGAPSPGDTPAEIQLELSRLYFDAKDAEPQAVADLLFEKGVEARSCMEAVLVEFRWLGGSAGGPEGERLVSQFVAQSFGQSLIVVSPGAAYPEAVAYMRMLRPQHMHALRRLRAPLTTEFDE
mmetsp:Transcript_102830/g.261251  ORF Transcript_102830/g.261251 Transcript_102830/m.261251 type:complete len:330 (+) Transcript_102830:71-1060(+)|eukprot:CAMPEP_0183533174 /NCGR_PEP_ID=MMETSP0371-20130417/26006_1 /TAXON_ID=268820 /ORGANISM="Peridinium aciculiferum, Strain PAER-2" /LENGTH=329 /DNA_ID=CAMNT_0025733379 /DNA_START=38 /DNA_END=1027 /DNA_ORIENTATION=+